MILLHVLAEGRGAERVKEEGKGCAVVFHTPSTELQFLFCPCAAPPEWRKQKAKLMLQVSFLLPAESPRCPPSVSD